MQFWAIFRQFSALNFEKVRKATINITWKDKHVNFAGV